MKINIPSEIKLLLGQEEEFNFSVPMEASIMNEEAAGVLYVNQNSEILYYDHLDIQKPHLQTPDYSFQQRNTGTGNISNEGIFFSQAHILHKKQELYTLFSKSGNHIVSAGHFLSQTSLPSNVKHAFSSFWQTLSAFAF